MINKEVKQVETCFKRQNLDKSTTLSEYAVKNANKRKNEKVGYEKLCKQIDDKIKQRKYQRIRKDVLKRGVDLDKIFRKTAETRTALY